MWIVKRTYASIFSQFGDCDGDDAAPDDEKGWEPYASAIHTDSDKQAWSVTWWRMEI